MGFNKRYISKENILLRLNSESLTSLLREVRIDQLFKADALILDHWSSNFYNDLNPKEREIRKNLYDRYKFSSSYDFIRDEDYENLNSLAESLISLCGETPMWIDIFMTANKLNIKFTEEETGRFSIMKDKCIESIVSYFDKS
jgi:hypothetical protein